MQCTGKNLVLGRAWLAYPALGNSYAAPWGNKRPALTGGTPIPVLPAQNSSGSLVVFSWDDGCKRGLLEGALCPLGARASAPLGPSGAEKWPGAGPGANQGFWLFPVAQTEGGQVCASQGNPGGGQIKVTEALSRPGPKMAPPKGPGGDPRTKGCPYRSLAQTGPFGFFPWPKRRDGRPPGGERALGAGK